MATLKGTLSIVPTKKGKDLKANFVNHKGNSLSFTINLSQRYFSEGDAEDGCAISITLDDKNQMKKVTIDDKEEIVPNIAPKQTAKHDKRPQYQNNVTNRAGTNAPLSAAQAKLAPATAPYNFIPQNTVLWVNEHTTNDKRYSGTLTCNIKTLRPLLVSGAEDKKEENAPAQKHFFTVNGCPTIPGSSLKGMLRSLVETLSLSALSPINERKLFVRDINDKDYYMPKLVDRQKSGYLVRQGADYSIQPVGITPVACDSRLNPGKMRVCTGKMNSKKHDYDFDMESTQASLIVPDDTMKSFFTQLTPAQETLVKNQYKIEVKKLTEQDHLPVFYTITEDNKVDFLGIAKFFRYPTQNNVEDLAKPIGKQEGKVDFAARLFGFTHKNESLSGRVAIQAATFPQQSPVERLAPTVLGQPHETCFAHYLVQDLNTVRVMPRNDKQHDVKSMKNYNTGGTLRGRKMYWHRDPEVIPPPNNNVKVASILHPLKEDAQTTFTIHLHKLTQEELGAVLETLELPEGHAHKLGMGKSLGLGSVRIDILEQRIYEDATFYANIQDRCNSFFAQEKSAQFVSKQSLQEAKKVFRLWVLRGLGKHAATADDFEKLEHIQALRKMMDFENRPKNQYTKNMELKEFKALRVLENPQQVYAKK